MNACILNVSSDEYDQILQLNHDALVWSNLDHSLLHSLETLLGKELVDEIRTYDECRMQKQDTLKRFPRIQEANAVTEGSPNHFAMGR